MTGSATLQAANKQAKPTLPVSALTRRAITTLAESDCPILIIGEAGVGKRSVAEFVHAESRFRRACFVEVHAADCTLEQLRSVLSTRATVYLSEVSDLNDDLQELTVENYFCADEPHSCRLLCGTSREPVDEVKSRRMREDFFHLISAVTLRISPLRFRKSEILSIADDLLSHYSRQFDRPKPILGQNITDFLLGHTWPGNLTELHTAIKTFVIIGEQSVSLAALKAAMSVMKASGPHRPLSLKEATRAASIEVERRLIAEVLTSTGGNRKRAADELGISYKALLYKLKKAETLSAPSTGNGLGV